MLKFLRDALPLLILLSSSIVPNYLCQSTTKLITCLTQQNVNNFTILPGAGAENESIDYYKLLHYSIQNLRFAQSQLAKPVAIILPECVEQLVSTVSCCSNGSSSWGIRVRCGGHSYEGISSTVAPTDQVPFVIIDMMNLNQVSIDLESETAWVEGGATLGETYYSIAQSSNTHGFSAGSCPTVGIGGHISGGGFGLLSRKYGLAADNVLDALLVDADGRLLDRQGMGEEVFWAIRGGGGGVWGIVYAWKISLSKVPHTVTGFIAPRQTRVSELVHKWQYVAPELVDDFYMSAFVGAGLPEAAAASIGSISATFKGFYLGSRNQLVSILNRVFPELGITEEDCTEMSWIESVLYFSGLKQGSSVKDLKNRYLQDKGYFKAKSDYVRTPISVAGINAALEIMEEEPKGYVILDPYGGMMQNISNEAIAFPHRKGNLFAIQYLVEWKEEDNGKSKQYIDWIRGFYDSMTPYVSWAPRAAYINYVDLDLGIMDDEVAIAEAVEVARAWGEKYFLSNFQRLVRAKTFIDPNNVFNNQQGIPSLMGSAATVQEKSSSI